MVINSILDVTPEMASDIRYLWDETNMTTKEIALNIMRSPEFAGQVVYISLDLIQDILGGAYVYEDHQN
jgi:hypothetical protein